MTKHKFSSDYNGSPFNNKALISDQIGNSAMIGGFGELLTGSKIDDISVQFQYNQLNTEYDLDVTATAVTGDGVISATGSTAVVSSATNGTATIQSKDSIRYIPGHTAFADFTASFNGNGTGYAGPHDDNDGFVLKCNNDILSFGYLKGGVETGFVSQESWNGTLDPLEIDFTKLNIFRILFGYLGVANPTLWIKLDAWYPLVVIKTEGRLDGTHVNNPVFPIRIRAVNGMTIESGSWNGGTVGGFIPNGRPFHFPKTQIVNGTAAEQGQMTLTSTNVGTVVIFHLKDTFQGVTNKVKSRLLSYDFHIDVPVGNVTGTVIFQIVANPTLSGAANYVDINSNSSTIEYDHTPGTGASVGATLGAPIITAHLEYVGSNKGGTVGNAQIEAEKLGAIGKAGDTFAIVAKDTGGNGVTIRANLHWEELF